MSNICVEKVFYTWNIPLSNQNVDFVHWAPSSGACFDPSWIISSFKGEFSTKRGDKFFLFLLNIFWGRRDSTFCNLNIHTYFFLLKLWINCKRKKEPVAKEPVYWNDFTLWDNATWYARCGQKSYSIIFFFPVGKIISLQEIYSDILFGRPCPGLCSQLIFGILSNISRISRKGIFSDM